MKNTSSSKDQYKLSDKSMINGRRNDRIIDIIECTLHYLINSSSKTKSKIRSKNIEVQKIVKEFSLKKKISTPIKDLLRRIVKYSECEINSVIYALVLLDRLIKKKDVVITEYNVHLFLIISIYLSIKMIEDTIYDVNQYSIIFGIDKYFLIEYEEKFLTLISYELNVDYSEFKLYQSLI